MGAPAARPIRKRAPRWAAAALLAGSALAAGRLGAAPARVGPTHSDLDAARRRVDRLDCELALSATRRPYVVLDLGARTLTYRLMGMTLREIPLADATATGLLPAPRGAAPPLSTAGILTLQEKTGDPRLSPLTPEQIEAGLDDENTADALPPDPPASYALAFRQPVGVAVAGVAGRKGIGGNLSALRASLVSLFRPGGPGKGRRALRIDLRVDETRAQEIWRSLVPGERWLVLPPAGSILPDAGQETPRDIRPARAAPRPIAPPSRPGGVPFQIPQPVPTENPAPLEGAPAPTPTPSGPEGVAPVPAERLPEGPGDPPPQPSPTPR
jgi:hypothetical protein